MYDIYDPVGVKHNCFHEDLKMDPLAWQLDTLSAMQCTSLTMKPGTAKTENRLVKLRRIHLALTGYGEQMFCHIQRDVVSKRQWPVRPKSFTQGPHFKLIETL